MDTSKYSRKPFEVEAVQITEENFDEVVRWCTGLVETKDDGTRYIRVRVHQPMNVEQTHAYVGDWVLYSTRGFKIYKDRPFRKNFVQEAGTISHNVFKDTPQELRTVDVPVNESDQIGGSGRNG